MSRESDEDCIDTPERVNIHEILNAVSQLEALIEGHPRLLWQRPRDFYNFLTSEVKHLQDVVNNKQEDPEMTLYTEEERENSQKILDQLAPLFLEGDGVRLSLHSVMQMIFQNLWTGDGQWTTSDQLISSVSWTKYIEQSSDLELCLTLYTLDPILTSLEVLKEIRIKQIQKTINKELKRKASSGLDTFVKKSKTGLETEASRDPSSSLTSTSSRIMNTCKYKV